MKRLAFLLTLFLVAPPTFAQEGVAPLETAAKQAILIEAETGDVLFSKDADQQMPTSSMSKVMTMHVVFDALKKGKLKMDETLPVSEHAWKQEGSRMFLNVGERAKVEDLIRGVIVQSGNDAAVTLAEAIGSTESGFADLMNAQAKEMGLTHSHFMNATGLPDPQHYSTARDLAMLALATISDYPEHYHYYSEIDFTYNKIKQGNRNPLLYRNMGVDGLKTGHTEAAGFGLMASSVREGRRLILVLNGLKSMQDRADESAKAFDWGYREYGLFPIVKQSQPMAEVKVWLGQQPSVALIAARDVKLSMTHAARAGLKVAVKYNEPVEAPIVRGQELGKIVVTAPNAQTAEIPLVANADIARVGFFERFWRKLKAVLSREE